MGNGASSPKNQSEFHKVGFSILLNVSYAAAVIAHGATTDACFLELVTGSVSANDRCSEQSRIILLDDSEKRSSKHCHRSSFVVSMLMLVV